MHFRFVGYDVKNGIVKGHLESEHESDARAEIEKKGLKIIRLSQGRKSPGLETLFPSLFKVKSAEVVRFSRQLATMLASGGNLLRALEMLADESANRVMRKTLIDIKLTLDEGGSLSDALARHPKIFNGLFTSVVEVGEYTGKLAPALDQLADILEKEQEAKAKAVRTLMYPMAIMGLSMVTLAVLMTVALPPLLKVFEKMDTEIPLMTRVVIAVVGGASKYYAQIGIVLFAVLIIFAIIRSVEKSRYAMDRMMIRAPMIGSFILAGELSRFSRTLSMLLEAGVTLTNAIHLGINGCKNQEIRNAFAETEESLLGGHSLLESLRNYPIIPRMYVELVSLGEETNSLQRTMKDAADAYQKQLEQRLDALLGMLEPVSTVVVGAIVGVIAFSMFVPIYSGLNAVP